MQTTPTSSQQEGAGTASSAWQSLLSTMNQNSSLPILSGEGMVAWLVTDSSGQPAVLRMKNMGDHMVDLAEVVITATGFAEGAGSSWMTSVAKGLTGWVGSGAVGAISVWVGYIKIIADLSLGFFMMCSLYLPLIPFIVFMGQILAWLLSVIEGVAAAPFLAFAHFDTDGEGMGQRTAHGYTFMLQSFMRPVMLVFSFLVASKMVDVMGNYLMEMFPLVVANAQMNSMTGFFSILGYTAIFMVLSIGIVNSCFSIMYILPEALWTFMGATGSNPATQMQGQIGRDTQSTSNIMGTTGGAVKIFGSSGKSSMMEPPVTTDGGGKGGATGGGSGGFTPAK